MEKNFAASLADSQHYVLWEQITAATPEGFVHTGYTDNYMRVKAVHPLDLTNRICATRLGEFTDGIIHGTVLI